MTSEEKILFNVITRLYKILYSLQKKVEHAVRELNFIRYKLAFGERDDDIYVVTYPKSGTTLMQMMLYQILTNGEMTFNHIYDVSPWIRNDALKNNAPRDFPSPRIIKTHDPYRDFDKATRGRFIFVHRNGMDVAVSYYHQIRNYQEPDLTFDQFLESYFNSKKFNYFTFTADWFRNKSDLPVLYIRYEDLIADMQTHILNVARFIGVQIDPASMPRILTRCSFAFMKEHQDKFGEQPVKKEMVYDQFIRSGKQGEGEQLFSDEQKKIYLDEHNKYLKEIEPQIFPLTNA